MDNVNGPINSRLKYSLDDYAAPSRQKTKTVSKMIDPSKTGMSDSADLVIAW